MVNCYNELTERSVIVFRKGDFIISNKENIKKEARSLFAKKGYYGTSISDIANAVGLTKSSLYAHFSSKNELLFAVIDDVTFEHGKLFERLIDESENMEVQEKLRYHFEQYILHFRRNPELLHFSNMALLHVPAELSERIRSAYLRWEKPYREKLEVIFREGIQKKIIRQGDPVKKVWSFKTKRDGVVAWVYASPDLTEQSIRDFWDDFWFGVAEN